MALPRPAENNNINTPNLIELRLQQMLMSEILTILSNWDHLSEAVHNHGHVLRSTTGADNETPVSLKELTFQQGSVISENLKFSYVDRLTPLALKETYGLNFTDNDHLPAINGMIQIQFNATLIRTIITAAIFKAMQNLRGSNNEYLSYINSRAEQLMRQSSGTSIPSFDEILSRRIFANIDINHALEIIHIAADDNTQEQYRFQITRAFEEAYRLQLAHVENQIQDAEWPQTIIDLKAERLVAQKILNILNASNKLKSAVDHFQGLRINDNNTPPTQVAASLNDNYVCDMLTSSQELANLSPEQNPRNLKFNISKRYTFSLLRDQYEIDLDENANKFSQFKRMLIAAAIFGADKLIQDEASTELKTYFSVERSPNRTLTPFDILVRRLFKTINFNTVDDLGFAPPNFRINRNFEILLELKLEQLTLTIQQSEKPSAIDIEMELFLAREFAATLLNPAKLSREVLGSQFIRQKADDQALELLDKKVIAALLKSEDLTNDTEIEYSLQNRYSPNALRKEWGLDITSSIIKFNTLTRLILNAALAPVSDLPRNARYADLFAPPPEASQEQFDLALNRQFILVSRMFRNLNLNTLTTFGLSPPKFEISREFKLALTLYSELRELSVSVDDFLALDSITPEEARELHRIVRSLFCLREDCKVFENNKHQNKLKLLIKEAISIAKDPERDFNKRIIDIQNIILRKLAKRVSKFTVGFFSKTDASEVIKNLNINRDKHHYTRLLAMWALAEKCADQLNIFDIKSIHMADDTHGIYSRYISSIMEDDSNEYTTFANTLRLANLTDTQIYRFYHKQDVLNLKLAIEIWPILKKPFNISDEHIQAILLGNAEPAKEAMFADRLLYVNNLIKAKNLPQAEGDVKFEKIRTGITRIMDNLLAAIEQITIKAYSAPRHVPPR